MAKKKDIRLNRPESKAELTKENMLAFVKGYATVEQTEKFIALVADCKVVRKNNLTGNTGEITDIQKLRAGFIKLFDEFAYLEKKKKTEKKKAPSFDDELAKILADKKAAK